MSEPVLELKRVVRTFRQAGENLVVLRDISLRLAKGEIVALVGPSGAGKSTLLHVAGLLERPDNGAVRIEGRDCGQMSDVERTEVRRAKLGFVYQFHHLLPEF
jgi:lipoprotein-releasing system ATP-binding protein